MKWNGAMLPNTAALTTVKEGNTQKTFLPDNTSNSLSLKQGSGPEQTHKECQVITVTVKKPLKVRDTRHRITQSQRVAKCPRGKAGKHQSEGGGNKGTVQALLGGANIYIFFLPK